VGAGGCRVQGLAAAGLACHPHGHGFAAYQQSVWAVSAVAAASCDTVQPEAEAAFGRAGSTCRMQFSWDVLTVGVELTGVYHNLLHWGGTLWRGWG
jgi:hypothetical protein